MAGYGYTAMHTEYLPQVLSRRTVACSLYFHITDLLYSIQVLQLLRLMKG